MTVSKKKYCTTV